MPVLHVDGFHDFFEPWKARFDSNKDMHGCPFVIIGGQIGFWVKDSKKADLTDAQIQSMQESLQSDLHKWLNTPLTPDEKESSRLKDEEFKEFWGHYPGEDS